MLEHTDVVHGLYYLIMWPLVRVLGFGELGARLPSAIAMSAAAAGTAAIGRRLLSLRAGLAAGLTFAILPVTSRYGQEARSYAMVLALAVTASYLLVRVIEAAAEGAAMRRWLAAYAAVLALMGWANLVSLLIIPAHAVTLVWPARSTFSALGSVPRELTGSWLVLIVVLALGLAGVAAGGPARTALRRLCVPWLLLPPFFLLGTGLATPVYDPRYILFCVPAIALLAGSGLDAVAIRASARLRNRARSTAVGQSPVPPRRAPADVPAVSTVVAGLAVIALLGLPAQLAYRGPDGHGDNIRQVAQILASHEHGGDAILYFWPWWRQIGAAYPAAFRHLQDIAVARSPEQDGNFTGTQLPGTQIRRRLATVRSVWLVEFQRFQSQPFQPYPALTGSIWKVASRWHASDFVLTLYVHR